MRHGRSKQNRRTLQFFERTVGFRPPYHVLLDGTFVTGSLKYKIPIEDRLSKLLQQSPYRIFYLPGTLSELHNIRLKSKESDVFDGAIQFLRKHGTKLTPSHVPPSTSSPPDSENNVAKLSSAAADIYHFVSSANSKDGSPSYMVVSQDDDLLAALRNDVTVPLGRLAQNTVLILERPSKQRQEHVESIERTAEPVFESQPVDPSPTISSGQGRGTKHKAKAPNPLSCKKKKKRVADDEKSKTDSKSKRKRRRKKSNSETSISTD